MTVLGGYVTFKRGSVLLKTPLWVCFLLKAKVFCQIIYVVSVAERPVSKHQPDASLDASKAVWGSWKKHLQRGVTPLYSAPLTFVEGARQRWDSPGLLKVMDVLIFASAHTSSSCHTKCLCILTSLSSRPRGHLWSQCFLPHTSVCAHASSIISETSTLCPGPPPSKPGPQLVQSLFLQESLQLLACLVGFFEMPSRSLAFCPQFPQPEWRRALL